MFTESTLPDSPVIPPALGDVQWFFFDLDGTLADSITGLHASISVAFQAVGRVLPATDLRPWIGPGVRTILSNMEPSLTDEELDVMVQAFRAHYDSEGILQTEMFAGISELLHILKDAGRRLFIITNKPKLPTGILLRSKGLDGLFDAIVSRNSREPPFVSKGEMLRETVHLHKADLSRSVMVGDTEEDAGAAREAGMRFIHAAYGYGRCASNLSIEEPFGLLQLCLGANASAPWIP